MKKTDKTIKVHGSETKHYIILTLVLYAFWIVLSGIFKPKFLMIGLATALVAAWITRPLLRLPSANKPGEFYIALDLPYFKLFTYVPWLFIEILKANIDVVKLVLDPKMPIDPLVITFKKTMSNPLAHVLLANSITLTPGTVTMDLDDGVYYIHAINKAAAAPLLPPHSEDSMPQRVAMLFNELENGAVDEQTSEGGSL